MKRILCVAVTLMSLISCIRVSDSGSTTRVVMYLWNNTELDNLVFESNIVSYLPEIDGNYIVKSEGSLNGTFPIAVNEVRAIPNRERKKIDMQGPYPLDISDMIQNYQEAYLSVYLVEEDGTKTLLKTWYSSERNKGGAQFFDLNQWEADRPYDHYYIPEIHFFYNLTKDKLGL